MPYVSAAARACAQLRRVAGLLRRASSTTSASVSAVPRVARPAESDRDAPNESIARAARGARHIRLGAGGAAGTPLVYGVAGRHPTTAAIAMVESRAGRMQPPGVRVAAAAYGLPGNVGPDRRTL